MRKGEKRRTGKHPEAPRDGRNPERPLPSENKAKQVAAPYRKAQYKAHDPQKDQGTPILAFAPDPFDKFLEFIPYFVDQFFHRAIPVLRMLTNDLLCFSVDSVPKRDPASIREIAHMRVTDITNRLYIHIILQPCFSVNAPSHCLHLLYNALNTMRCVGNPDPFTGKETTLRKWLYGLNRSPAFKEK